MKKTIKSAFHKITLSALMTMTACGVPPLCVKIQSTIDAVKSSGHEVHVISPGESRRPADSSGKGVDVLVPAECAGFIKN